MPYFSVTKESFYKEELPEKPKEGEANLLTSKEFSATMAQLLGKRLVAVASETKKSYWFFKKAVQHLRGSSVFFLG